MSELERLIQQHCPNGVEYLELSKVCRFQNGFAFKSALFKNGGNPVLRITNIVDGKLSEDNYVYFDENDYNVDFSQYKVHNGAIVIAMSGATTGKIGYNYSETEYYLNQRVGMFVPNADTLSNRYLYHWLMSQTQNIYNISAGAGAQPNLSSTKMMEFLIPVPPIEVQSEIVRILDNFTELTVELKEKLAAELTARKKQYEYYRDSLLTFGDDTNFIKLSELFNTRNGYTPSKSNAEFWDNGEIPWFRMEDIRQNGRILSDSIQKVSKAAVKGKPFPANSLIVATSATIGEHALITCESISNQRFTYLTVKDQFKKLYDIKFLYYYCFKLDEYCKQHLNQGNFASVDMGKFNEFPFPVITLEEQKRIVAILDRFDTLCNDISAGLPAEIEARQKQYEYYRDKLLTFND